MATTYRDPRARTKINYIATAPFNVNFYNYTQSTNPNTFEVTGALSAVTGASAAVCPKGRILRENGKRLFPGGSYPGISTFMVGVYDANSGLSGYIDPNAECFAYYNVDKPVEVVDGVDPSGNVVHRGASVYTSGNILADGSLKVGGTADVSGAVVAIGQVRSSTVTPSTTTTGPLTIDPSLGQVFTFTNTLTGGVSLECAAAPPAGSVVYVMFTDGGGRALSAGSNVNLSPVTMTNAKRYSLTLVSNGSTLVAVSQLQYA